MKYRLFSVLIILAMVASLCAVAVVAPASADVAPATVTVSNSGAGLTSAYTVTFGVGAAGALSADTDDVLLTFPAGTTLPSSMDYHNVLVATAGTPTAVNVGVGGVDVSGQTVTVNMPMGVANSGTVTITFTQGEGIANPQLSREPVASTEPNTGGYTISVSTSQETTAVASTEYYIYNWIQISPTAVAMGDPVTVVGGGFMTGSDVTLAQSMGVSGMGSVASDGTFTIEGFATGQTALCGGTPCPAVATDGTGRTAQAAIATVLPRLTVSPASGNIGSTVVLKGYDFTGTASGIAVTIAGISVAAAPTWIDNDNDLTVDDFVLPVTIPSTTGGQKVVSVVNLGATGSPTATSSVTIAEHAITVSPASGAAGSTVVVTGAGWPPNDNGAGGGMIMFAFSAGYQSRVDDGTVATDGTGAFTETITIPASAQPGLTAIACAFGTASSIAYFTVAANALTITPASGPKGTRVTVSGGGLTHSTATTTYTASMTFGGAAWGSAVNLDTQGNLTPSTTAVANAASEGINSIRATDNSVNALTATGIFEVTKPTLELDLSSVARGQTVTATGSGWFPGVLGLVTIYLNSVVQTVVTPDADGNIWAQFQVSTALTPGNTYSFYGVDSKTNTSMAGTAAITTAVITIDPESGVIGSSATVTGTGFLPLTPITSLTLGNVAMVPGGTVLTDALGGFSASMTIPGLSAGGYGVSAQVGSDAASTSFTISASAATAATAAAGFATISDCIVIAWAFDAPTQAWLVYDPTEGATSTLENLATGQGYWIEVAEDCTLTYGSKTYSLTAGWNLIGWLG